MVESKERLPVTNDTWMSMSNSDYRALLKRMHTAEDALVLMTAERDGLSSQLLDVQRDSIAARKERLKEKS